MRFLVDAQLPHRLSQRLTALGHEATHTSELVEGNRTTDRVICAHADAIEATVITKDADSSLIAPCMAVRGACS